jgi:hypothetical protein
MTANSTIQRYTDQKAAVLQTNHPIVPTESFQPSKTTSLSLSQKQKGSAPWLDQHISPAAVMLGKQ